MEIIDQKMGCYLLENKRIEDIRGWFSVALNVEQVHALNLDFKEVVQLNHSYTKEEGVVRGPNYQLAPFQQAKIVRCIRGKLYSVAVDLEEESETYGKWCGFILDSKESKMMYIPRTYAHGFISLTENTELEYFTDEKYDHSRAKSFRFDDQKIGIDWTLGGKVKLNPDILSDKNRYAPSFEKRGK